MHNPTILYPLFVLATWTAGVLLLIPATRIRAAKRGEVSADDFKFGESSAVPPALLIPNHNYMNLLEAPVLFYVVCLILYVSASASPKAIALAWIYVALRMVHSLIHLTYNKVAHRLSAFAASNGVLIALWIMAGLGLYAQTGA
jgi:hypothetical protein